MKEIQKRFILFVVFLAVACTAFVPVQSAQSAEIDQSGWITSGIYQYRIIDEEMKSAALLRINSSEPDIEIPKTIDGYTVISVGGASEEWNTGHVMGSNSLFIKSLKIPDTVRNIGRGAFAECSNLEKVDFPKTGHIKLCYVAFEGCKKLKNISLSNAEVEARCFVMGTTLNRLELNNVISRYMDESDAAFYSRAKKIVLSGNVTYSLREFRSEHLVDSIYVNGSAKIYFDVGEGGFDTIRKMYVNSTSVTFNDSPEFVENLYTIPSAKILKAVKKAHVTYHVKSTGPMKKVSRKEKGKKYSYSWKPVKTTIKTYKYRGKKKGWKCTKKKAPTQYYVYAKKSRLDKYQLIKTTKKRQITTGYKYVKVKPVKIWLESGK